MAIKYVSGKTRELRVGLSSYSEGKASLQVIGNVGVGTTNPLSVANPANTSVINAGIVTANKLFGDIVATGVGITNLNVTGISTFGGNVFVGTGATVGFGTTVFFNNDLRIESPVPTIYLTDTNHDSDWYIQNSDGTIIFYDVTTTNTRFEINPGAGGGSRPFIRTPVTTDSIFNGTTTLGGSVLSPSHSLTVAGVSTFNSSVGINSHLNVTGVSTLGITTVTDLETQHLNVSGLSTFAQTILLKESSRLTLRDANASIYHQSNQLRLETSGTGGDIKLTTNSSGGDSGDIILNGGASGDLLTVRGTGDVNITNGLNVGGFSTFSNLVRVVDNQPLIVGNTTSLSFQYNSGLNKVFATNTSDEFIIQGPSIVIQTAGGNKYFTGTSDIAKLYHTNNEKLATTNTGINVTGLTDTDTLLVSGISTFAGISTFVGVSTFNDDVNFIGDAAGITSAFWDKSANELKFYDGSKITLGDGQDLELSHNGTDSLIRDSRASGSVLRIGADKLWLQNKDGNEPYLEATDNGSVKLYHDFLPRLETTGIGITIAGIGSTAYIEGPENIIIDPHPYGVGTTSGNVFIRGDLYVEGTEFIVDVDKIELGDFQIGIATTAGTNALLDGAGIGIGSTNIRKFITWNNATNALMSSENWNLASGKHYEINGTDVLTSDTLQLLGTGAQVHSPSSNILTLKTNGAERLRVDASGNLGIGTATPTDSANAANTSVTSAGIVTAVEYYGIFKGSIPGFSTVFSSGQGFFSATPGSAQIIDQFAFSTHDYKIAEYTLHFVHANGIQAQKSLVMQNNSVAYSEEYGVMYDSELLVSIAATVSGSNVNITATPEAGISGVTTFRWRREVQT